MKTVSSADIVRLLKEEYEERQKLNLSKFRGQGTSTDVLAKGLKVRHKETNLLYTVDAVTPKEVFLKTGEGQAFAVDRKELTRSYKLD